MPEYGNPYNFQSPIGAALKNFSSTLARMPSEAQQILIAEHALKAKRENENVVGVGDVFNKYGTPAFDRNMAMNLAIRAGLDPARLAGYERYATANRYGVDDPRTTNAYVGAGGAYSGTKPAFDVTLAEHKRASQATLAENQRQFDEKPYTVGGPMGPVVSTQRDAVGQPAVEDIGKVKGDFARRAVNNPRGIAGLNPTEQHFIGAQPTQPSTPRNYLDPQGKKYVTYDGRTDAQTGQPLPPGGSMFSVQGTPNESGLRPNVQGRLQETGIELQKFNGLLDHTLKLAQQSPSNFGVAGMIKGAAQDAGVIAQNLAEGLGYKGLQDAVEGAKQKAIASGVSPESLPGLFTFDPTLPSLHTAADLLTYQAASALAGQSGRSVSDRDIKIFRDIVGDPRDWSGNQQKFLAKLGQIKQILDINQNVVDQNLRGGGAPSAAAPPAAPGATPPVPQAPGAPQVERWERGPDGQLRRVQ
jgi:hypothetical protein